MSATKLSFAEEFISDGIHTRNFLVDASRRASCSLTAAENSSVITAWILALAGPVLSGANCANIAAGFVTCCSTPHGRSSERPEWNVSRRIRNEDVADVLRGLSIAHGIPQHIRSDNGPELIAAGLRSWLGRSGVGPMYIAPGSPWENGYAESFNSRLRDEFLGCEIFDDVQSAQPLGTAWRVAYNQQRPHSSLGYMTPAEFARTCTGSTLASATPQPPFQQHTSLQT